LADALGEGSDKIAINLDALYKDYSAIKMISDGTKVQVELAAAKTTDSGKMELTREDGVSNWYPIQFHFHAPSEHTVMGEQYDLEMHIVHLGADGSLGAVLGIFFDTKKGGSGTNMFLNYLAGLATQATVTGPLPLKGYLDSLNLEEFWSYDGSLTTPPCTEGVRWSVLKQVQPISADQLKMFNDTFKDNATWSTKNGKGGNYREVQPFNSRPFYFSNWEANEHRTAMIVCAVLLAFVSIALVAVFVSICACPKMFGLVKAGKVVNN